MTQATCTIVLHSHLPYVLNHGRWPHGSAWLCEAAAETYLPLIRILNELVADGKRPRLTVGVSPILAEQLAAPAFKNEFVAYLQEKIDAAAADIETFLANGEATYEMQARAWRFWYESTRTQYLEMNRDVIGALRSLSDLGVLELLTCGATHGYYPLLSRDESLDVQTRLAVATHQKHFGKQPRGIWLPECAYRPGYAWPPPVPIEGTQARYPRRGVEEFLARHDLAFFVADASLISEQPSSTVYLDRFDALRARFDQFSDLYRPEPAQPGRSPHQAYRVGPDDSDTPVHVFPRDPATGVLVWSGEYGYPGDGNYLEFHKKRSPGGLRYWAVTSIKTDPGDKRQYNREAALERVEVHAADFVHTIESQLGSRETDDDLPGVLVAPYDAELFGHWWFEGPEFLKRTLELLDASPTVKAGHLSGHLAAAGPGEAIPLPEGSWGLGSNHSVWLNERTAWSWTDIYACEKTMVELATRWVRSPETWSAELRDTLTQAGRELLLLSSSDWQFLISSGSAEEYATGRLRGHAEDFRRLADMAERLFEGEVISEDETAFLTAVQARDAVFAELDIGWFAELPSPGSI